MRQATGSDSLSFPDLEEQFGEIAVRDAAHTLNRDNGRDHETEVRDDTIPSRIRGIDSVERIRVFVAVENRMRNRRGVLEQLARRKDQIEQGESV